MKRRTKKIWEKIRGWTSIILGTLLVGLSLITSSNYIHILAIIMGIPLILIGLNHLVKKKRDR